VYWNNRVFTSILLVILFSILFASTVDSQSDEEKSIASIPFIQPASAQQSTSLPGYIEQESYSGDCKLRPSGTVCIAYSDGYIWLVSDSIKGWEDVQEDGKNVKVAVGFNARYYHILNTNFVKSGPLITQAAPEPEPAPGYIEQESYSGDCGARPSGTVCARYSDGYIWLISDSVLSSEEIQEDGKNVEVVVGIYARYYHIPNTNFVKTGPLITQAAPAPSPAPSPEPVPEIERAPEPTPGPAPSPAPGYIVQESYSGDCGTRPSGTVCIAYSDGYVWLVFDSIQGWEDVQEDGKNVKVAVGNYARYYHILNPNLVWFGPLERERYPDPSYIELKPYSKDCLERKKGTVCLGFADGFIWLVSDSVRDWEDIQIDGKKVQIAVGFKNSYYHLLNPNLIKTGPLVTQAAPEPAPEPAPPPSISEESSSKSVYGELKVEKENYEISYSGMTQVKIFGTGFELNVTWVWISFSF